MEIGIVDSGEESSVTDSSRLIKSLYDADRLCVSAWCDLSGGISSSIVGMNAAHFGITEVYTDIEDMFESEDLDLILVCMLPSFERHLIIKRVLEKGISVFTEKPPQNLSELLEIAVLCKESNSYYCGYNTRRYIEATRMAVETLSSQQISSINLSLNVGSYPDIASFFDNAVILYCDLACYLSDKFVGERIPETGYLITRSDLSFGQTVLAAILKFSDIVVTLHVSSYSRWNKEYDRFEIIGSHHSFLSENTDQWKYFSPDSVITNTRYTNEIVGIKSTNPSAVALLSFIDSIKAEVNPLDGVIDLFPGVWLRDRIYNSFSIGEPNLCMMEKIPSSPGSSSELGLVYAKNGDIDKALEVLSSDEI